MGAIWTKSTTGWKQSVTQSVRQKNGWARVIKGWRKTGPTTWVAMFTTDLTAPSAPVITSITVFTDTVTRTGKLRITITAPAAADTDTIRVKVGKAISSNNTTDSNYVSTVDGSGQPWSEWKVTPNQVVTKTYPMAGSLTNGATYYVTAWAVDKTKNYSAPTNKSVVYKTPTDLVAKQYKTVISPTDSATVHKSNNTWISTEQFCRTGGPNNDHGLWFYSTRFNTYLKAAARIWALTLQVQRYPGNAVGNTNFKLFAHRLENQPVGSIWSPNQVVYTDSKVYSIARSQTLNVVIPPAWFAKFITGEIKGLGIYTTVGATNDVNQSTIYGVGTFSGRLTAEYSR